MPRLWLIILLCASGLTACSTAKQIGQYTRSVFKPAPVAFDKLSHVRTLAGVETENGMSLFGDPFGIAVGADDTAYVTDGERGVVWAINATGETRGVIENLNTPSGIALAPDGSLVVAETGAHVIRRINIETGASEVIAGKPDAHGYADGRGGAALFNAPIGIATDSSGAIYVADTYNDRIRQIDFAGNVSTLAGGGDAPGYADAEQGIEARFHTPCNLILRSAASGELRLIVADTGNHRLREIEAGAFPHRVTTLAGTGERGVRDGARDESEFNQPIGLAFNPDDSLLVTDAGGDAIRRVTFGKSAVRVTTLNSSAIAPTVRDGEDAPAERRQTWGFRDAKLDSALLHRPTGIAVYSHGRIVFTDTDNRLVRVVVEPDAKLGAELSVEGAFALLPDAATLRGGGAPRWAFDPPEATREIAATFGEVRGVVDGARQAWFHNGLDVPGIVGETTRFVRAERMLLPLSIEDFNTGRERVRLPLFGYIHVRIGRTHDDFPVLNDDRYMLVRGEGGGRTREVRIRRGTRFNAGEPVGTLNGQAHVHLIAGAAGGEVNALAALELPGASDSIKPTIVRSAVRFERANGEAFATVNNDKRIVVDEDARIIVRAYDQMDGNLERRRLGVYALGFQVLQADGAPVEGFEEPQINVEFLRLPEFADASAIYAAPSQAGYTGRAIFDYIVTNRVRDRAATPGLWQASRLASGDYTVRIVVKDFFSNVATEDFAVRVERRGGV